jgi:transcriptional/translational regulatory protein YebC/TACO1
MRCYTNQFLFTKTPLLLIHHRHNDADDIVDDMIDEGEKKLSCRVPALSLYPK